MRNTVLLRCSNHSSMMNFVKIWTSNAYKKIVNFWTYFFNSIIIIIIWYGVIKLKP